VSNIIYTRDVIETLVAASKAVAKVHSVAARRDKATEPFTTVRGICDEVQRLLNEAVIHCVADEDAVRKLAIEQFEKRA
jgi:hypothetical protein